MNWMIMGGPLSYEVAQLASSLRSSSSFLTLDLGVLVAVMNAG